METSGTQTCGELLVKLLQGYGVETVFGIPGVHTVELYRGLEASGIRHISPRHEQGAGFMADGYARVSGKPGVCFIITGPGMTNILTAMAQAAADSVPMLVISSVNPIAATGSGEGHLHELRNQQALIGEVAAFSQTVWRAQDLPKILARAFAVFSGARPRPVHIQIPIDVMAADASAIPLQIALPQSRPQPPQAQIEQAAAWLKQAKSPVVLFGGGCVDVDGQARQLVEQLDAPVFTSINAKGLLGVAHPLSLGSNQSLPAGRALIANADVVLAIGTELGETDYDVGFDGGFAISGRLIRVDCDSEQLQRPFVADLAIFSDAQAAISTLCEELSDIPQDRHGAETVAALRQQMIAQLPKAYRPANALLAKIRECLPEVILVGDSTQPVYAGNHGYEAVASRRWFNASTGYGTLGYALPAAMGARLATGHPVVCVIGDGGIQFTLAELICAAELEMPLIVLLWHNQGYGEIRRYMQDRGIAEIGVNIRAPDFQALAPAFYADYQRIDNEAQFEKALSQASRKRCATILEVDENAEFLQLMGENYVYFQ